jgi:hypothetical protein
MMANAMPLIFNLHIFFNFLHGVKGIWIWYAPRSLPFSQCYALMQPCDRFDFSSPIRYITGKNVVTSSKEDDFKKKGERDTRDPVVPPITYIFPTHALLSSQQPIVIISPLYHVA